MGRFIGKKQQSSMTEENLAARVRRFQKRHQGREFALPGGLGHQSRRHGWGFVKRRSLMEGY
jgi:hypothetical protein